MSIKLVVLSDKSVVVQNKVKMNFISHNSTCDLLGESLTSLAGGVPTKLPVGEQ